MQLWLREVVKCVGYEWSNNLGRQAELWERRTPIIIRSQKLREQKPKKDIASKEGRKSWHLSIYTGTPTKIDDKVQKDSWKLFGTCVPIYLLSLLTCENAGVPSLRIRLFVLSSVFKHASRQNQSTWSSTQCFTTGLFGNDLKSGVSWVNFVISLPVDHNCDGEYNGKRYGHTPTLTLLCSELISRTGPDVAVLSHQTPGSRPTSMFKKKRHLQWQNQNLPRTCTTNIANNWIDGAPSEMPLFWFTESKRIQTGMMQAIPRWRFCRPHLIANWMYR